MLRRFKSVATPPRRAVAATELAVILPLFVFFFVLAVDFGRVFYSRFIVISAARNGAIYGSTNPSHAQDAAGIQQKTLADAKDLAPELLQIQSKTGTDSAGHPCIDVTVTYQFNMITNYLITSKLNVASRVRMRVRPLLPTFN